MFGFNFLYVFVQIFVLILYLGCVVHIYKIDVDNSCPVGIKKIKKQPWLFYTLWNLAFQHVFLIYSLLNELVWKKCLPSVFWEKLDDIKRFYFASILCPSTLTVVLFFWPVFLYNRNAIYPKALEVFLPPLFNYTVHLFVLIPLVLEFCKNREKILQKFDFTLKPFLTEIFYLIVVLCTYYLSEEWPYSFISVINWPLRVLLIIIFFSFKYTWFRVLCYFKNVQRTKTN